VQEPVRLARAGPHQVDDGAGALARDDVLRIEIMLHDRRFAPGEDPDFCRIAG
jgi:hypothetical protein